MEAPNPEQVETALQTLEDLRSKSSEPIEQVENIYGAISWMLGRLEGREVADFIAASVSQLDQLNAKARDIADSAGESPGTASE